MKSDEMTSKSHGTEDMELIDDRIWIDGCFDFFHHGHAGVMLQARQQGTELFVGVHSDAEIEEHKGPPVMRMDERVSAAAACRWVTKVVPDAPYVTSLAFISEPHRCRYVVHGDDITSDSGGEDCYRFVKAAHRFKVVKRTEGISTTDLVGRMLLLQKNHFIRSFWRELNPIISEKEEDKNTNDEKKSKDLYMRHMLRIYASDEMGIKPGVNVYIARPSSPADPTSPPAYDTFLSPHLPLLGQRIVYVDGGFDLFSSGHIEFLRQVCKIERQLAEKDGWHSEVASRSRIDREGKDYERAHVVVGMHEDLEINRHKGGNYPIMNVFERGLCVLQCKYISTLLIGAPFEPTNSFLKALPMSPGRIPDVLYHGRTSFVPLRNDPYADARTLGIFAEVPSHPFQDVNAADIVSRILNNRERFEKRQRAKVVKGLGEEETKRRQGEA